MWLFASWWRVTSIRLETTVACTVRRGDLLFLCHWPTLRTSVAMITPRISTNITVNSTGNTESKKPKPNIKRPLFLSFAYIVSDAGMARKFPFKNKKLVQIPL